MTKNFKMFVAVLAVLFVGSVPFSKGNADETKPEIQPTVATTPEGLEEILNDLAYEPTRLTGENGNTRISVQIRRNRRDFDVVLSLSRDGKLLTVSTQLNPQTNHAGATAAVYLKLLEKSNNMGSMVFAIDGNGALRLMRGYETRYLNHAGVRKALDQVGEYVVATESLWKAENFPTTLVQSNRTEPRAEFGSSGHLINRNPFDQLVPQ